MVLDLIGVALMALGLFFFAVGVVGVVRLPDAFSRLHASGKVGTAGLFFLLLGVACLMPTAAPRLLALGVFMILSAPLASHAIAMGAHRGGLS